eukprot:365630-Chlamydomonas_euryale.AAC.27
MRQLPCTWFETSWLQAVGAFTGSLTPSASNCVPTSTRASRACTHSLWMRKSRDCDRARSRSGHVVFHGFILGALAQPAGCFLPAPHAHADTLTAVRVSPSRLPASLQVHSCPADPASVPVSIAHCPDSQHLK